MTAHDGDRLFLLCMLFLPALHVLMDLAFFNGFAYILVPAFLLSRAMARVPPGREDERESQTGVAPRSPECPEA